MSKSVEAREERQKALNDAWEVCVKTVPPPWTVYKKVTKEEEA